MRSQDEECAESSIRVKKQRKSKKCFVTANITNCKYDLVKSSIESNGILILKDDSPSLASAFLFWVDSVVPMEKFYMLKNYQHINHFPSMGEVCRKDLLARNIAKVKRARPQDFNFTPKTWNMPSEYNLLLLYAKDSLKNHRKPLTCIQKPANGAMGNGIHLFRNVEKIHPTEHTVVQEYLDKPLLLDGYKFDLRLYVLVTSCDPLRVFLYQDGLVRLSTEKYSNPTENNVNQLFMHLTNYSVNKQNEKFERHSDFDRGSKRSVKSLMHKLKSAGYDTETLWRSITDLVIKTMLVASPHLLHSYKMSRPGQPAHSESVCFEILGFDIFVDKKLKPWLLEVNRAPSFGGDEKIDRDIKGGVIRDAIRLLNIRASDKKRNLAHQKAATQRRLFTPAQSRCSSETASATSQRKAIIGRRKAELKEKLVWARREADREEYEDANLRGYQRVFPCQEKPQRDKYMSLHREVFKIFQSQCAPYQRSDQYLPDSVDELLGLIEQCEAEEGIVPTSSLPLSSMPILSPPSSRRNRRRGTPSFDTSSSSDVTSSEEDDVIDTRKRASGDVARKMKQGRSAGKHEVSREAPFTEGKRSPGPKARDKTQASPVQRHRSTIDDMRTSLPTSWYFPRYLQSSQSKLSRRSLTHDINAVPSVDRDSERTQQTLAALERTRIKFPGKSDQEADVIMEKIMNNWKHHKPLLATYWLVKLDSAKRKKVIDIVRGSVRGVMQGVWRGCKIDSLRLMRLFSRVFNRMYWSHGQGLWSCFTTSSDSWEIIFSKSTDNVNITELDCCRRVVHLCKDCLLVVYQFANDVNGHVATRSELRVAKDPRRDPNPSYSADLSTPVTHRLPMRFTRPYQHATLRPSTSTILSSATI